MAMSLIDYVTSKSGSWATQKEISGNVVELKSYEDGVVFQGPVSLNVAVVAEATLVPVAGGNARSSVNDLYSYDVEVPAGYTWRYQMSDGPAGQRVPGYKVIIRATPCACHPPPTQAPELPCDYAVGNLTNIGQFFPVGCEPCGGGPVRLPPTCGPSLAVMPASGGCVRPRFFNGMFITREDLETQLRYLRIKNQLQRRADGDGVVWGLGLGRDGNSVCVQPGYAVDCCGNDLVVTSNYKVDTATLLSDPAVCNLLTGRRECMSLLLEYIECPEQPRPVHGGDPCASLAAGCEMSRVRETVRLRLVPTRDYQPRGPIQRFLDTISQGNKTAGSAQTGTGSASTSPSTVPFNIQFATTDAKLASNNQSFLVTPSTTASVQQPVQLLMTGETQLTVTIPGTGSLLFSAGSVQAADAGTPAPTNVQVPQGGTNSAISWQSVAPTPTETYNFIVGNWSASAPSGGTYSGTTNISVAAAFNEQREVKLTITVAPTQVTLTGQTGFPCLTDPCCGNSPLFPVTPPWADANPFKPGQAADLEVILMAVFYILLAGATEQDSPNLTGYQTAYAAVAKLVDPNVTTPAVLAADTQAMQQMLADLCCSLLYPGPSCHGEPHGVVIGCATIAGREIERVDPWSGRRWVMHYPLWSYWGAQFGLVPADVLASRMFSFVCCVAGLKPPGFGQSPTGGFGIADFTRMQQRVAVGAGQIVVNPAPAAAGTSTESVSMPVFAARVLSALGAPSAAPGTPMTDIALAGNPAIHLLVPNPAGTAPAPQPAAGTPATGLTSQMQAAIAAPDVRTAVPPLLRSFAATLGTQLLNAEPLATLRPPATVLQPMLTAGVTSVGALLAQTPDALYATVLGKTQATDLSNLLTSAEDKPSEVAHAVAAALKAVASHRALVSTDDLAAADARAALAEPLTASLHLPANAVNAAIAAALA